MLTLGVLAIVLAALLSVGLGVMVGGDLQRERLLLALREEQRRCVADSSRRIHS